MPRAHWQCNSALSPRRQHTQLFLESKKAAQERCSADGTKSLNFQWERSIGALSQPLGQRSACELKKPLKTSCRSLLFLWCPEKWIQGCLRSHCYLMSEQAGPQENFPQCSAGGRCAVVCVWLQRQVLSSWGGWSRHIAGNGAKFCLKTRGWLREHG